MKIYNFIDWTDGWREDDLKYEWRDTNPVQTYPMPSDLRLGSADGSNLVIKDKEKSQFVQRSAKRRGCLLSYGKAEAGRELTQPRKYLLAEPCMCRKVFSLSV